MKYVSVLLDNLNLFDDIDWHISTRGVEGIDSNFATLFKNKTARSYLYLHIPKNLELNGIRSR